MLIHELAADPAHRDRSVTLQPADWLREIRVVETTGDAGADAEAARDTFERRTADDVESVLLVLSGTHDLFAGGGSWLRRGLRAVPFEGRPVAVFLPPGTPYRAANGAGRILVASTRRPAAAAPPTPGRQLSEKPLLPLAGSGKAFDPQSGSWLPQEAFPDSPEAILPRRIQRIALDPGNGGDAGGKVDGGALERVLDFDYKTRGLCLDEVTLRAGASAKVTPPGDADGYPAECAVYVWTEGSAEIGGAGEGDGRIVRGECVVQLAGGPPPIRAVDGRTYCAIVYAGPKSST